MSVSLCMIVKDEEEMLERCLNSVKHLVNEMIIVDTGSTDATISIAESFGAKIFHYDWDGSFANARNRALKEATGDWILIMDADDELEFEDTEKLVGLLNANDTDVYYLNTLSFSGDAPVSANIVYNLNVRLIRNFKGYLFTGDIHEQLVPGEEYQKDRGQIKNADVRFYHYGYLTSTIKAKNKRQRNIGMIQKELDKYPDNAFMLFNMGTEYYALQNYREALRYYLQSYRYFKPDVGFCSKLVLRIVLCYEVLEEFDEEIKYIDKGLRYYPDFTDLEFIRGYALVRQGKHLAALRSLQKCVKMGESPAHLCNLAGVGTFRAHQMLGAIYAALGENDRAERHCRKSLEYNRKFKEAYALLHQLYTQKGMTPEIIAARIAKCAGKQPDGATYLVLSDLFYDKDQYTPALDFARKAGKQKGDSAASLYAQGVCLLYLKKYREADKLLQGVSSNALGEKAAYLARLCMFFAPSLPRKETEDPLRGKEHFQVLDRYQKLLYGQTCPLLAEDPKSSKPFIDPIFHLLEILMKTGHFDDFEKALGLLNLVDDGSVLLRLAKLYHKNGQPKLAYREFLRSIKLSDLIDAEGLEMMKKIVEAGITV